MFTLVATCQCLGDGGNLDVAELCEGVSLRGCEGVVPHEGIHGRAVEKRLPSVPRTNHTRLQQQHVIDSLENH